MDAVPADDPRWAALRAAFPAAAVSKMPRITCGTCKDPRSQCTAHRAQRCSECGGFHSPAAIHLDYVGHADVTARLDEVDPHWGWEPAYRDLDQEVLGAAIATGNTDLLALLLQSAPARYTDGGLWIRLTVLGVTRLGFGDAQGKTGPNAVKELIGDAIRNAAMRFGVATYLWSKSEAAQALRDGPEEPQEERSQEPPRQESQSARQGQGTSEEARQAVADAGARLATRAGRIEEIAKIRESSTRKSCIKHNIRAAITEAEFEAAAAFYPSLKAPKSREFVPLWGWLDACAAVLDQNGTSVHDAAALAAQPA